MMIRLTKTKNSTTNDTNTKTKDPKDNNLKWNVWRKQTQVSKL